MIVRRSFVLRGGLLLNVMAMSACQPSGVALSLLSQNRLGTGVELAPKEMPRLGRVDERFQSYNIEMLELTGGRFWKPYGEQAADAQEARPELRAAPSPNTPPGMDPALYEYRPPLDLGSPRLRLLAAALGPAYVRSSGTWANATYFPPTDAVPTAPPAGFNGVLSHRQWRGLVDFARAVDGRIVTSFAISAGTRDAKGVWTPEQARRLIDYTASLGGRIAAAEFMNEPNLALMGSAPAGYDAAAYGRDFRIFRDFVAKNAPDMLVMGPGSVGESEGGKGLQLASLPGTLATADLLAAAGPGLDVFSYHHYGAASRRCAGTAGMVQITAAEALSEEWLARPGQTLEFYRKLRDRYAPGKPIWISETADAACGGNPWASTFLDTFRYLDQLGRMARQGVQVVMHNTLVASDYGLLDDRTLEPKPNYWGALLWRRLMGSTVLDPGTPSQPGLHLYAHCLRDTPGGVAVLAINTDKERARTLSLPRAAERYSLQADSLESRSVRLNGKPLALGEDDALPALRGVAAPAGYVLLEPASITFLAVAGADNAACR